MKDNQNIEPQCWTYELVDGWTVFAGKTAEDNDVMSLRFAKGSDLWFHIHGQPGSHVLLRGPEGQEASKELKEQAAAIAAWHSKARGGGKCTVDMTFARNVSKPRGAKPGLVCISGEKLIHTKPALPANAGEET